MKENFGYAAFIFLIGGAMVAYGAYALKTGEIQSSSKWTVTTEKRPSFFYWYLVGTFLIVGSLTMAGGVYMFFMPADQPPPSTKQDITFPLHCSGSKTVELSNQTIEGEGPLITATGTCHIKLDNCRIHAKGAAISGLGRAIFRMNNVEIAASGLAIGLEDDASAFLSNSKVESEDVALMVQGNSVIDCKGTKVVGKRGGYFRTSDGKVYLDSSSSLVGEVLGDTGGK